MNQFLRMNLFFLLILVLFTPCCGDDGEPFDTKQQEEYANSILPEHLKDKVDLCWSDEFDGETLDLSRWNYRAEGTTRHYGIVSRETIKLDGLGHVVLSVLKDAEGKYYIGQIGTQGLFGYSLLRLAMLVIRLRMEQRLMFLSITEKRRR